MTDETKTKRGALEEFRQEASEFWWNLPDKQLFFGLLAIWVILFHLLGNSVFGWVDTPSLFGWMYFVFDTSADDEHGKLIPFVVLALFWWKRHELMAASKRLWLPGLAIIGIAILLHIVGFIVQQTRLSIVGFFMGLYGLMGLVWGPRWLFVSFFPMILFAFCVPLGTMGETLTFPLRMLATNLTSDFCSGVLGINLIQQGTYIFEPAGRFKYEVAAACGGIRSLTTMLALTTIFGFVQFKSPWRRLIMLASALPLALAGNVFRLTSIIIAAEAFGKNAGDFVHEKLGLLPYIPAIVGILLLGHLLREKEARATLAAEVPSEPLTIGNVESVKS